MVALLNYAVAIYGIPPGDEELRFLAA